MRSEFPVGALSVECALVCYRFRGRGAMLTGTAFKITRREAYFFARAFLTFHEASLSFRTVLGIRQVAFGESVLREPGYSTVM